MSLQNSSNPFVGLRSFESDESILFFGRQEQTLELLQRLHQNNFVAVVGSSGSGKSSLIKAGLIPSLKAGYLIDDRDRWAITIMKPGQSPLFNLAKAIISQLEPDADDSSVKALLKKIKEEGADAILNVIENLWEERNTNFFLLVDQFEELFRFSMEQKEVAKKDEATDFVNIILELSRQQNLPVYVVITMRSDFIGDCSQFYGLPEAMNKSQYLVPRLNRVQLKNAIQGPVKLYGKIISTALTSKLLNDAVTVKDELPLLQHVLMRIWDYEMNVDRSGKLDLNEYEAIGGIEKALSNHADEALKGMSDDELIITKKLFQSLTAIDENGRKIRRPAYLKELEAITGKTSQQLLAIINRFIEDKRSFVIISKAGDKEDEVIDISHESLIRQWDTLSGWVDEEGEAAKNYLRLVESAELYKLNKKDLLTGSELQIASQWYNTFIPSLVWTKRYNLGFEDSIRYLNESIQQKKLNDKKNADRKKKQMAFTILSLTTIMLLLVFFSVRQSNLRAQAESLANSSQKQQKLAEQNAREAKKQKSIADEMALRALQQTTIAVQQKKIAEEKRKDALHEADIANNALHNLATESEKINKQYHAFVLDAKANNLESDDPTTALRLAEFAQKLYPDSIFTSTENRIYETNHFYHRTIVNDTFSSYRQWLFSNDNTKILLESNDSAKIWNVSGLQNSPSYSCAVKYDSTYFSPDLTKELITKGDTVVVLNTETRRVIMSFNDTFKIIKAYFTPYGNKIVILGQNTGSMWDLSGNKIIADIKNLSGASSSRDGFNILTESRKDSANGTNFIYSLTSSVMPKRKSFFCPRYYNHNYRLLPDGNTAIIYIRNQIYFWNIIRDAVDTLPTSAVITKVIFSQDGSKALIALANDSMLIWNKSKITKLNTGSITSMCFSSDGSNFLTLSNNVVTLWEIDGTLLNVLKQSDPSNIVSSITFLPLDYGMLMALRNGSVETWKTPMHQFVGNTKNINLVTYSPDGRNILTGSEDGKIILWNANGNLLKTIQCDSEIASVAFSPNGKQFLAACGNTTLLWNTDDTVPKKFYGHNQIVQSVAFSNDGSKILSGGDDGVVRMFNLNDSYDTGKIICPHNLGITSLAFSLDDKKILAGSRDFTAKLWSLDGTLLDSFKHNGTVYCVAFSPDGTKILTGSADRLARVWNFNGILLDSFKHNRDIESVAFSFDGKVLTGSWDYTVKLWDNDGKLVRTFELPPGVRARSVAFSPDRKEFFVGASDGIGRLYDIRSTTAQEFLKSDDIDALTEKQKKDLGIIK